MTTRLLPLLLLVACAPEEEGLPDGAGVCPTHSALAAALDIANEELFRGQIPAWPHPDPYMVFQLEGEWEAFRDSRELGTGTTDFGVNQVIVGIAGASSSCGLRLENTEVVLYESNPHLDLTVVDTTGACDEQCDQPLEYLVAVAVGRDSPGTGCSRVRDVCE